MMEVSKWYFKSYLPVSYFKITTDKSYEEVMKILDENIEQNLKIRRSLSKQIMPKYFEGIIYENQFKIYRFDNNFRTPKPIIYGYVTNLNAERIIEIKMRLSKFQIGFSMFYSIFCFIPTFIGIIDSIQNNIFNFYIFLPLIMIVGLYSLNMFFFPMYSEREREYLEKLFR